MIRPRNLDGLAVHDLSLQKVFSRSPAIEWHSASDGDEQTNDGESQADRFSESRNVTEHRPAHQRSKARYQCWKDSGPGSTHDLHRFRIGIDGTRAGQYALHPRLDGEERSVGVRQPIYSLRREIEGHINGESEYPGNRRRQHGSETKPAHDHCEARPQ